MAYNDDYDDELDEREFPDEHEDDDPEGTELRDCPHCGQEVYADAVQCPNCGDYITGVAAAGPKWVRHPFVLILVLLAAAMLLLIVIM